MVTIDFSKVRPNGIGLERYSRWKGSTFRAVYERAEQCLSEIVQAGSEAEEPDAGALFQIRISDQQNRVMAFVGDRGTGKTSAMISFVNPVWTVPSPCPTAEAGFVHPEARP